MTEEPDLPEKFTQGQLASWVSLKHKQEFGSSSRNSVFYDAYGLLHSEQHRQGLSASMKRFRRDMITKPPRPDLKQVTNSKLPPYLQDVERYNPELMNRTTTREHGTLPTKAAIEEEIRVMKAETRKMWHWGPVLKESSNLVDPKWKREMEETFISRVKSNARDKSVRVFLGALRQFEKEQESGIMPNAHISITIDHHDHHRSPTASYYENSSTSDKGNALIAVEQTDGIENLTQSTETEEIENEEGILRHSSR